MEETANSGIVERLTTKSCIVMTYEEKKFIIPELDGISAKSVEEHLGLYAGYVKNFNAVTALAGKLMKDDAAGNALAVAELMRRRSFEFGGMRLHEYYFAQFEDGAKPLTDTSFESAIKAQYGEVENLIQEVRQVALMRGPGWSILYYDPQAKQFLVGFSEEQHQGHFVALPIILALDVWEHAFLLDYGAQGKAKYVEAFFKNLNWGVLEARFASMPR